MKLCMTEKGDSEQVVSLEVDLSSASFVAMSDYAYDGIEYAFSSKGRTRQRKASYAMVVVEANIEWREPFSTDNFEEQYIEKSLLPQPEAAKRLVQMMGYACNMSNGADFPAPILMKQGSELVQADGARRIIAHRLAGHKTIQVIVVLRRKQIAGVLDPQFVRDIQTLQKKRRWFDDYQDIIELAIPGRRKADVRFPNVLDFARCGGGTVVDFGCNTGHTLFEAYYNGAERCVGFEYTQGNVDIINNIAKALGISVEAHCMDFNDPDFESKALKIIPEWDYSLFLSVYRTRELRAPNELIQFIWRNSKAGMFFEGHSDPNIDNDDYCRSVLRQLGCDNIEFVGQASDFGVAPRLNYFLEKEPV